MKKTITFFLTLCSMMLSTVIFAHNGHGMDNNVAHEIVHSGWVVAAILLLLSVLFMVSKRAKNK